MIRAADGALELRRDSAEAPQICEELWDENGAKASGTWEDLFGRSARADEIFMAWHYAKFIQAVTARGKRSYDIPMFVNTWLDGAQPGQFPSGGPRFPRRGRG